MADINLTLGKGKVYFEQYASGATTGNGEVFLAQTTEFNYTVSTETLDAYDADSGLNVLIAQVTTQVGVTGTLKTRDISVDNLGLFLLSDGASTITTTSSTGATSAFVDVKRGRYLQLGKSTSNPSGVRNATVTSVAKTSVPGTPLLAASWSQTALDVTLGRVYIDDAATDITDLDELTVTYNVAASTHARVVSKDQQIRGGLRFVADNPNGTNRDYYFPLVNMAPDGDYALKGDDWQSIGFKFTTLKRDSNTERVYIDGRPA